MSIAKHASLKCAGILSPPEGNCRLKPPNEIRAAPKHRSEGVYIMLAEKFILLLETLKSRAHPDGSPIVVSTSPHVPIKLPGGTGSNGGIAAISAQ